MLLGCVNLALALRSSSMVEWQIQSHNYDDFASVYARARLCDPGAVACNHPRNAPAMRKTLGL